MKATHISLLVVKINDDDNDIVDSFATIVDKEVSLIAFKEVITKGDRANFMRESTFETYSSCLRLSQTPIHTFGHIPIKTRI